MTSYRLLPAVLAAGALLLAGCASSTTAASTPAAAPPSPTPAVMTPGMVMPDGSVMGAAKPSATPADAPSSATAMICSDEIRTDVGKVLGLPATPPSASTWNDHLYTCTYSLAAGPLVLTVKQSSDAAAAKTYFDQLRPTLGPTTTLAGLGEESYGTAAGKVVLIKDNDTLMVDATALPAIVGAYQAKRADFAYQLASDILGCWTGNGS